MNEAEREALGVQNIKTRNEKLLQSDAVGGVREWFDIAFLLKVIARQENTLAQVHLLAAQGIENSGAVNAYRLKAALDGERVIDEGRQ